MSRARPHRSADTGERFLPAVHRREMLAAEHLARYAWAAQAAPGRIVLDAGCGVGYGTAMLARAGARAATGVDADADAIADARLDYGQLASFAVGDLLALAFERASFTLVTCFEAIEHVADPERTMHELSRVLTDDGLLLVSSPNRGVYPEGNPFHLSEYTAQELEEALRGSFEHVSVHRQEMHLASLIADREAHAAADPEVVIAAGVRRLEPGVEGRETYTIAAASAAPLPALPNVSMLTGGQSYRTWFDAIGAWERRARRAEAEAAALRTSLGRERMRRRQAAAVADAQARRDAAAGGRRLRVRWRRIRQPDGERESSPGSP